MTIFLSYNCYYEKCGSEVKNITEELPFEIPDSWCWVRVTNVGILKSGYSFKSAEYVENGVQVVRISDLGDNEILQKNAAFYPYVTELSDYLIVKGSFLICQTGSIGKMAYVNDDVKRYLNQRVGMFIPIDKDATRYLWYFFHTDYVLNKWISAKTSTNGNIKNSDILDLYLPIPPIAEQQRIVYEIEKIEPLIAEYDKLEQQATKLDGEIYDKLKKSILQYAIQGKLVPQDKNDEPASELLKRIRAEKKTQLGKKYVESYIYKGDDNCYYEKVGSVTKNITDEIPFDIPDSWSWARIDEIFQHNTGKALNSSNTKGSLKNYITTSNLYWGHFKLDSLKQMLFTDDEVEKCSIRRGDLLVCEGGDIGRAAIWNYDVPMCIQNHIHRLRAFSYIEIQFYYYVFYLYKQLGIIGGKGIGIQGLSTKALGKIIIPIPPLNEQRRILDKISMIFDNIKGEV